MFNLNFLRDHNANLGIIRQETKERRTIYLCLPVMSEKSKQWDVHAFVILELKRKVAANLSNLIVFSNSYYIRVAPIQVQLFL